MAAASDDRLLGFGLPAWAHVPGETAGPDEAPLAAAKALVPSRFDGRTPPAHPALRYGLALCDGGFFWEAHEVLEAVWMASAHNGRDRLALRAVIQFANAGLKLRMGRPRPALRLLEEVRRCLHDLRTPGSGDGFAEALDREALTGAVDAAVLALEAGRFEPLPPISPYLAHGCRSR